MDRSELHHVHPHHLRNIVEWAKWKADLTARLQRLREENDNDLDEKQTARLRGRIAEIKSMLALDVPDPALSGASADTER